MTAKQQQPKPKRPRRPRREYGIGDFLSYIHSDGGMANAARRVAKEDKIFKGPLATEKIQ
jgi:hypothetical protein